MGNDILQNIRTKLINFTNLSANKNCRIYNICLHAHRVHVYDLNDNSR